MGTSSAVAGNGIGGVGVAPDSKVVPLTITHQDGASYWDSAKAFVFAVDGPDGIAPGETGDTDTPAGHMGYVDIVNYSFGGDNYSQILREGIQYVLMNRVVFVTSAGNTPTTGSGSASWVPGVISVAASTPRDERTTFSNRGIHLTVAAPGDDMWLTATRSNVADAKENAYSYIDGTSFAGPATAGLAALILEASAQKDGSGNVSKLTLSPAQVRHIMEDTAYNPVGRYDDNLGYGVVRSDKAVALAADDAANKVEKGASVDMRFVAASDPTVGIPLVGVTLSGGDRRPDQLLYGQSSAGDFVFPTGLASFYEIDAGLYKLYASGPRPVLTGINPGSAVQTVQLDPGDDIRFGNRNGVFPLNVTPTDENEPNDSVETATPIAFGQVREAVMTLNDADHYSFEGTAGQNVYIGTQSLLGSPDLKLELLNAAGQVVAENTSAREDLRDAALTFTLPASGRYTIRVTDEATGNAFNTYAITLSEHRGTESEPNGGGRVDSDTFKDINLNASNQLEYGWALSAKISPATDVDIYRFSGTEGDEIFADTLALKAGNPDLIVALLDDQGEVLDLSDDFTTQDSLIEYELPKTGQYYLAVGSFDGANKGSEGDYVITLSKR
ncbi:S8 family serine peptidase [Deinococcus lacus]|uniref:S8 family serine peptidase n=1 Tax=Deinococcus lacus TaxID=392561 RepID=A0ABW1YFG4_9DEIO